jgi:hypothetical protein
MVAIVSCGDQKILIATRGWSKWDKVSQLKIFNHHHIITIFGGNWIVLVATKGWLSYFLESFCQDLLKSSQKTCGMPPFLVIEKLRLPFEKLWQLAKDHTLKNCPPLWGSEINRRGFVKFLPFQSPSIGDDRIWLMRSQLLEGLKCESK